MRSFALQTARWRIIDQMEESGVYYGGKGYMYPYGYRRTESQEPPRRERGI
jgi:hypothetical protein